MNINDKREESRQQYLPIREYQKLRELKEEIEDEERLFSHEELTEKEKQILNQKRELYSLAKQRIELSQMNEQMYVMPGRDGVKEESESDKRKRNVFIGKRKEDEEVINEYMKSKQGMLMAGMKSFQELNQIECLNESDKVERIERVDKFDKVENVERIERIDKSEIKKQVKEMEEINWNVKENDQKVENIENNQNNKNNQIGKEMEMEMEIEDDDELNSLEEEILKLRSLQLETQSVNQSINQSVDKSIDKKERNEIKNTNIIQIENQIENKRNIYQIKRTKHDIITETKQRLPVYQKRTEFLQLLSTNQIVIIAGETGSGKTTQLPQYLYEEGYGKYGKIAITQPRRVAAMSVARRVSEEMECRLGGLVGYTIRFEDVTSERTVIQYMTDGMLLRSFMNDPEMKQYSCIMIDEAHERTISTDILFGLLKDILEVRDDLKLIVCSATLDTEKFSEYFGNAPVFHIPGRMYSVDVEYVKEPEVDTLVACVTKALEIHSTMPDGDILIFLTGQEEVDTCAEMLREKTSGKGTELKELIITRIYSTLPSELQAQIFIPTPPNARKVVIATNIAETSLTVDGIVYVIDSGYCKINEYNPNNGMESLTIVPISQASADQRRGRAGRICEGKCYRMYTEDAFKKEMPITTPPEMIRSNLSSIVLMMKSLGIDDLLNFDFIDAPSPNALEKALRELYMLGALDSKGMLTTKGLNMSVFPMSPILSSVLITSKKYHCTSDIVTIVSMLQVSNELFYRPKETERKMYETIRNEFVCHESDHLTLHRIYTLWINNNQSKEWCKHHYLQWRALKRAYDIREQLISLLKRIDIELTTTDNHENILKTLLSGYFMNTAQLSMDGTYRQSKQNRIVVIHPSSCLFKKSPRWIFFYELVFTSQEFIRQVSSIHPAWLVEVAPHVFKKDEMKECIRQYDLKLKRQQK